MIAAYFCRADGSCRRWVLNTLGGLPPRSRAKSLAGKYRVERVLGIGGMGVVVAAYHLGLDAHVAVKLLLPEMLNQDATARFAREAKAAARSRAIT